MKVKGWQKTQARITKKEVVKRKLSSASRAAFKPNIEYTYFFNLQEHTGNKVFLVELIKGERGFLQRAAERFNEKIKPEIDIYINPQAPEQSVMFCDGILLYITVILMAIMSLLIGIANFLS